VSSEGPKEQVIVKDRGARPSSILSMYFFLGSPSNSLDSGLGPKSWKPKGLLNISGAFFGMATEGLPSSRSGPGDSTTKYATSL